MLQFAAFDELEIHVDDRPIAATPMLRRMVAALLVRSGEPVDPDRLAEEMWHGEPPRTARKTIAVYVHRLRRALGAEERVPFGPSGYSLAVAADQVDVFRFETAARLAGAERSPRGALSLWKGEPFRGYRDIEVVDSTARRLVDLRAELLEEQFRLLLDQGHGAAAIAEIEAAIAEFPYREPFREHLMLALYHGGRQADALDAYRETYKLLMDELGIQPTGALQELHRRILSADPNLSATARDTSTRPRQLPRIMPDFVGRTAEFDWLDSVARVPGGVAVVSAIAGTGGVGKTALAVQWAARAGDLFPSGQLYVNLRGHGPVPPMPPIVALEELLRAIGVPADQVPDSQDGAAALFRSRLADSRMLVLLDNAASVEQVRPLLPGGSGNVVIVTSRSRLSGLVARDGARRLELEALSPADARDLLRTAIGGDRFDAEPAAADELLEFCGGLPLALRLIAAQLIDRPRLSQSELRDRLATDRLGLLSVQDDPDAAIRAVFAASVARLSSEAAILLRRLGLVPISDGGSWLAGVLAGSGRVGATALGELQEASLVIARNDRYHLHDLVQLCASEAADADDVLALRTAYETLLSRVLGADAALRNRSYPAPQWHGSDWSPDDPQGWLETERELVFAVAYDAADRGWLDLSWRLVAAMTNFSGFRRYVHDWELAATHQLGQDIDNDGRAALTLALGGSDRSLGRLDSARRHLSESRRRYAVAQNTTGTVTAATQLGMAYRALGKHRAALAALRSAISLEPADAEPGGEFGWAYLALANLLSDRREPVESRAALERALLIFEAVGDDSGTSNALGALVMIMQDVADPAEVLPLAQRSYELCRALGEPDGQSRSEAVIASLLMRLNRLDEAGRHAEQALATARNTHHLAGIRVTLTVAGRVALARGDLERSFSYLTEAAAIARSLRSPIALTNTLRYLLECARERGDVDTAHAAAVEAGAQYRELGLPPDAEVQAWLDGAGEAAGTAPPAGTRS